MTVRQLAFDLFQIITELAGYVFLSVPFLLELFKLVQHLWGRLGFSAYKLLTLPGIDDPLLIGSVSERNDCVLRIGNQLQITNNTETRINRQSKTYLCTVDRDGWRHIELSTSRGIHLDVPLGDVGSALRLPDFHFSHDRCREILVQADLAVSTHKTGEIFDGQVETVGPDMVRELRVVLRAFRSALTNAATLLLALLCV